MEVSPNDSWKVQANKDKLYQAYSKSCRLNNRGLEHHREGQKKQAIFVFKEAIRCDPGNYVPYFNIACILDDQNDGDGAIPFYEKAFDLRPDIIGISKNLAPLYRRIDDGKAIAMYQHILTLEPGDEVAQHFLSALQGETPNDAPSDYVEDLFDDYAGSFDEHLTKTLNYCTPERLSRLFKEYISEDRRFQNVLDMGCGTGLTGALWSARCDHLVGIDLSFNMLEVASHKRVYHELIQSSIGDYLDTSLSFDLFIATDVFPYCGNLDAIFKAIRIRCLPAAFFIFSTETMAGQQFNLTRSGRFQHSRAYISDLLSDHGFELLRVFQTAIRSEDSRDAIGDLYIARSVATVSHSCLPT